MTTTTSTFGASIGRALGATAAYTVHTGAVAASYTGRFGKDIATGAVESYADNSLRLAALRAEAAKSRGLLAINIPERSAPIKRVATAKA